MKWYKGLLILLGLSFIFTGCNQSVQKEEQTEASSLEGEGLQTDENILNMEEQDVEVNMENLQGRKQEDILKGSFKAGASVHDPSIVENDGIYYIFGSHMEAAESADLHSWKSFASGVNRNNPLFSNLFADEMKAFQYTGTFTDGSYAVWAPDVIYNEVMQKWVMYFSTSHDYRTSVIHFATADNLEGPYEYQDALLYSGFSKDTVADTNFYEIMGKDTDVKPYLAGIQYNNKNYPNCIDPCVFYDKDGKMWMVYGSWSGGIYLLEIDEQTGYPVHPETNKVLDTDAYYGKRLIGGNHNSCEGPYLYYDEDQDMYYLLVSYGELKRTGGYQIRCFRSDRVDGEYVDTMGNTLEKGDFHSKRGLKMMGNYLLPSLETAYMSPGHCSVLQSTDHKLYLVHHTRFDNETENHEPRVHQMAYNEDGWPVALPFATAGEVIGEQTYTQEDICGSWYFLNHGIEIGPKIHECTETILKDSSLKMMNEDQTQGSYDLQENSCYMTIIIDEVTYKGILADMTDEAGNPVRCFAGAGDNNETLWGIMYL